MYKYFICKNTYILYVYDMEKHGMILKLYSPSCKVIIIVKSSQHNCYSEILKKLYVL